MPSPHWRRPRGPAVGSPETSTPCLGPHAPVVRHRPRSPASTPASPSPPPGWGSPSYRVARSGPAGVSTCVNCGNRGSAARTCRPGVRRRTPRRPPRRRPRSPRTRAPPRSPNRRALPGRRTDRKRRTGRDPAPVRGSPSPATAGRPRAGPRQGPPSGSAAAARRDRVSRVDRCATARGTGRAAVDARLPARTTRACLAVERREGDRARGRRRCPGPCPEPSSCRSGCGRRPSRPSAAHDGDRPRTSARTSVSSQGGEGVRLSHGTGKWLRIRHLIFFDRFLIENQLVEHYLCKK